MVPIMDRLNELQNVEAAQTTSSQIGSESCLSKKTKIFYSNFDISQDSLQVTLKREK